MIDSCPDKPFRAAFANDNLIGRHVRLTGAALDRNHSDPFMVWKMVERIKRHPAIYRLTRRSVMVDAKGHR